MTVLVDGTQSTTEVVTKTYEHQARYVFVVKATMELTESSGNFTVLDHDFALRGTFVVSATCDSYTIGNGDMTKTQLADMICDSTTLTRGLNGKYEKVCKAENVDIVGLDQNGVGIDHHYNDTSNEYTWHIPYIMKDITRDEAATLNDTFCTQLQQALPTSGPCSAYTMVACDSDGAPTLASYVTEKTTFVGQVNVPEDSGILNI